MGVKLIDKVSDLNRLEAGSGVKESDLNEIRNQVLKSLENLIRVLGENDGKHELLSVIFQLASRLKLGSRDWGFLSKLLRLSEPKTDLKVLRGFFEGVIEKGAIFFNELSLVELGELCSLLKVDESPEQERNINSSILTGLVLARMPKTLEVSGEGRKAKQIEVASWYIAFQKAFELQLGGARSLVDWFRLIQRDKLLDFLTPELLTETMLIKSEVLLLMSKASIYFPNAEVSSGFFSKVFSSSEANLRDDFFKGKNLQEVVKPLYRYLQKVLLGEREFLRCWVCKDSAVKGLSDLEDYLSCVDSDFLFEHRGVTSGLA